MQNDYGRIVHSLNEVKRVNSELEYKANSLLKVKKGLEDEIENMKKQQVALKADRDAFADKFNNSSVIHQKIFDKKMQETNDELKKFKQIEASRESFANAQKDELAALQRDLQAAKQDAQRLRGEVTVLREELNQSQARRDTTEKKLNTCEVLPSAPAPHPSDQQLHRRIRIAHVYCNIYDAITWAHLSESDQLSGTGKTRNDRPQ
jgi:chromosome segregation ATPase